MKHTTRFFVIGCILAMTWCICPVVHAVHIKVASILPEPHRATREMRRLLNEISKLSEGEVTFTLYAGGIAGDEVDVIRKMRANLLHMSTFTGVGITHIAPSLRIVEAPRLFQNHDEIDHVRDIVYTEFAEEFDRMGFILLGWADAGFVYIFSKQNLLVQDGFGRFKMWVWKGDPHQAKFFSDMGFSVVPLNIADVVIALETGMIDTCFGPPIAATAFQWHTRLNFMLDFPISNAMGVMLISKTKFLELSEQTRGMIIDRMLNNTREGNKRIRVLNEESLGVLKTSGASILTPSEKQAADYEQRARNAIENAIQRGLFSRQQYERILNILKEYRESPR